MAFGLSGHVTETVRHFPGHHPVHLHLLVLQHQKRHLRALPPGPGSVHNAQLGFLLGLIGFVQIFGYALLGWLQDLLPIRKLIAVDLWGYGIFALILGLVPHLPYWFLILAFAAFGFFGFFGDAIYWPTIQKSTKGLATERTQAAAFSTQECIRSAIGLVPNACTLGLFTLGGSHVFGARIPMCAYPVCMMLFSFVVLRFIPKDFLHEQVGVAKGKIRGRLIMDGGDDPYLIPGARVFRNKLGITDARILKEAESDLSMARSNEGPSRRIGGNMTAANRKLPI